MSNTKANFIESYEADQKHKTKGRYDVEDNEDQVDLNNDKVSEASQQKKDPELSSPGLKSSQSESPEKAKLNIDP